MMGVDIVDMSKRANATRKRSVSGVAGRTMLAVGWPVVEREVR